ncbi:type II secretion system major pseudopilin GspG [Agarilytica rhodophyticola]|uniref:type II secretion system major pseudopilin GspG n=1 Tax=Agarilytica rhodophyticola TaxID=1737490 RepID=UPI000B341A50|nr:type II secretion system major pseudopilin GspG [Agarilytica rhodophyticola]
MTLRNQQGMTLIEIMVVVVIIGLLAAAIGPQVIGALGQAQTTTAKSDFNAIETALKMYKLDNFVYPTSEQGLEALVSPPETDPVPKNWRKDGYLSKLPTDPWGNEYLYLSPAEGKPYDIYTLGADGVRGGVDEYADLSVWDKAEK